MDTQAYTIVAMIGRYILIILCFLVFIEIILEMRRMSQYRSSSDLASLEWKKGRIIFALTQENIIGRANKCDVVVKSPFIKRHHFKLYLDSEEWIAAPYKDCKMYINGFLIEDKAQVEDGDKISFGKEKMIFHLTPDIDEEEDE